MPGTFAEDVVVEPVGGGRYRATLGHHWDLSPRPQGGIVTAFALRAAQAHLDQTDQRLRTCTAVFAGPVTAGELEIDVTVLRRGRSASQVSATLRNAGQAAGTTVVAVFGSRRRGPSFVELARPAVDRPEACRSFRDPLPPGVALGLELGGPLPFWTRVEGRSALGHAPWEVYEPSDAEAATWLRFDVPPLGLDGALDPLAVVALADRMPGSVRQRLGPGGDPWFAPSADLTVHVFEPARTGWLLAHDRARWADDGWASAESTLWAEDGTLVAYATQMMIFTYPTPPPPG